MVRMEKIDLRDFTEAELAEFMRSEFGEKQYRARQIYEWLYTHNVSSFDEMTNLSKALRDKLSERCDISPIVLTQVQTSADGSEKLQFTLEDGAAIESVLMPSDGRMSLCVSTQVGCAMGCMFCFTGSLKLSRNLRTAEIVDQLRQAQLHLGPDGPRISNVVMMGMGEPLANFDNVVRACEILTDERAYNLAGRKVIVSTSGLIPKIHPFAEQTTVSLAVSLNATTDEQRSCIMPINKRYPLADLIETLRSFPGHRRKRIVLEYVLLAGENDHFEDARRLAAIANGIGCKVNLIPFNAHDAAGYQAPAFDHILAFQEIVIDSGVETFIRQSRGQDIAGACGMLGRSSRPCSLPEPESADN
jgi:23S rRNA (adenine2503-C2)-methyltransferase